MLRLTYGVHVLEPKPLHLLSLNDIMLFYASSLHIACAKLDQGSAGDEVRLEMKANSGHTHQISLHFMALGT